MTLRRFRSIPPRQDGGNDANDPYRTSPTSGQSNGGPVPGNDRFGLEQMDDLLKRADRAIEDSYRVREEAMEHLIRARRVVSQVREAVRHALADGARFRQLGLETADKQTDFQENPAGSLSSDRSD